MIRSLYESIVLSTTHIVDCFISSNYRVIIFFQFYKRNTESQRAGVT